MIQDELEHLLDPTIAAMGYELWGCEYLSQGKHSLLRVYIDKADGIGVEDCEAVSHQISALLDVEDLVHGEYSLEVSSPGISRSLFKSGQYIRYIGEEVRVNTFKPIGGVRKFIGTIVSASEYSLVLNVNNEYQELLFSNIVKAHLIV